MRAGRRIGWAATVGVLATGAILFLPSVRFAYDLPGLQLVLETADGLIGAVVAYLVFGRMRASRSTSDLLLVIALGLSAVANLFFGVAPAFLPDSRMAHVGVWAPALTRAVGAVLFAAAPWWHRRPVQGVTGTRIALIVLGMSAAVGGMVFFAAPWLPAGVDATVSADDSFHPVLVSHPVVVALQTVGLVGFVVGAAGYSRLALRTRDDFLSFVAAGLTLGAFARVHYLVFPSLYSRWVYTGDILRLAFWLVLLLGAAREVRAYWNRLADAAVLNERRRIARDLHDGVAQELAFIVGKASYLRAKPDTELERIAGAAERALHESRRAITLLGQTPDQPLPLLLARAAEDVAQRHNVQVRHSGAGFTVSWQEREALVRIVREAVNNAVRHGQARRVSVELEHAPERLLRIRDDGVGFRVADVGAGGYGLTSMTERAEGLGGRFKLRSTLGGGTEVEVVLP